MTKSRRMRWAGHVARMGEKRNAYRILVRKLEGKRPLGRPRRRWVDNVKMDLREIGWDGMVWIDVAQDRDQWRALVNTEYTGIQRSCQETSACEEKAAVVRHNDLPWNVRKFMHNQILSFNFTADLEKVHPWAKSNWSHTDLPRLRRGMVGAQFWSAYVPCDAQYLDAVQLTLEQIDLIKRLADLNPEHLTLVTSVKGVQETHRAGRIASLIGVEGGHSLGNSLAVLRTFYSLGARYMTVTHTCNTAWADCSLTQLQSESSSPTAQPTDRSSEGGLTEFGKLVVREMNRLGMMVDLSHASVHTMKDALAASKAPVMFSHSSAFALCNSSRNVPDDVLKSLALNGGIVMVNFYTYFITCNSTATINDVIAHINHIRDVAGVNHVGIGAGYDGINFTPQGLEDVSKYPQLLAALLEDPSWREEDLKKLAGLNLLRVFRAVEEVRSGSLFTLLND
ncbi:hypothetical protein B7P43_G11969 [Cryptotermes secundus]|uniref:Dipeptidase n=1 Tax=Cryptotermes secundus TaxID=105785 RepID=A0A2J7R9Y9_9NEOP|nr:hypothetical protein B7P43_G11969 [Cryptotermes secundus]